MHHAWGWTANHQLLSTYGTIVKLNSHYIKSCILETYMVFVLLQMAKLCTKVKVHQTVSLVNFWNIILITTSWLKLKYKSNSVWFIELKAIIFLSLSLVSLNARESVCLVDTYWNELFLLAPDNEIWVLVVNFSVLIKMFVISCTDRNI